MSKAKSMSEVHGPEFLRVALEAEQRILALQLELSSTSITHDGVMGDVNEQHFIGFLRRSLPMRYAVDTGIVLDSLGNTSDQIDVVIFDRQYTPTLLDQQSHRFIPAESVYAVFEVKPSITKEHLEYAGDKARSVRMLTRTSVSIPHAGGTYPPKPHAAIIAGIIASRVDWAAGLASESFGKNLTLLSGDRTLDCGVALFDRAFDQFDGALRLGEPANSLAFFLFRLLQRLQSLGTVPAVDWNAYAAVLAGGPEE